MDPDPTTPEGAFLTENRYAREAASLLEGIDGVAAEKQPRWLAEAQALATLALAYEQRQTRFDLYTGLENHAQQTGAP